MYVYTHFQSGSFIRTKSSASSRGGQPASFLQTETKCQWKMTEDKQWQSMLSEMFRHFVLNCILLLEFIPDKIHLHHVHVHHVRLEISLCSGESQLEVFPGFVGVEDWVFERIREEPVDQGTEGYTIFPTWGEVLDVHPLFHPREEPV